MSLAVISPSTTRVVHATLGLCVFVPLAVLTTRLGFRLRFQMTQSVMGRDPHWRGSRSYLRCLLGGLLPSGLRPTYGRDGDLDLMLHGTLRLLRGGDAEDVLQLLIHHVHPVSGGGQQSVQKRDRHDHIWLTLMKVGHCPLPPHGWSLQPALPQVRS
jgi:hypothetical protein